MLHLGRFLIGMAVGGLIGSLVTYSICKKKVEEARTAEYENRIEVEKERRKREAAVYEKAVERIEAVDSDILESVRAVIHEETRGEHRSKLSRYSTLVKDVGYSDVKTDNAEEPAADKALMDSDVEEAIRYVDEGMSIDEAAEEFGLSPDILSACISRYKNARCASDLDNLLGGPYIITSEQYYTECEDHSKVNLIYFSTDNVVMTENSEELSDSEVEELLGRYKNFDADNCDEENCVYIRNQKYGKDFRVEVLASY